MKSVQTPIRKILSTAILSIICQQVNAGGFSLYTEGSPAAIGNFAAGIAAEGADASIGWYNPAGLILIPEQELVIGGIGVLPSTKLTGVSTFTSVLPITVPPTVIPYQENIYGLQAAENAVVPALHYAVPINDRAAFGLSVVSPFGLSTNYSYSSPVRYAATLSKLTTVDVSPELGGKLTDHISLGLGIDLEYAHVKFNSMLGAPALLYGLTLPPNEIDSSSYNSGSSFGVGFHTGALFRYNQNHTRLGVNYQSGVLQQFTGRSQLTGKLADPTLDLITDEASIFTASPNSRFTSNMLYSNDIHLPQIVTLSAYQDVNEKLSLLGSVVWTGWDVFQNIGLNNVAAGIPTPLGTVQTFVNTTITEDYRNTWRFAVGANYHFNDKWMLRLGTGYDETPTVYAQRDVRLPDSNRWALAIGAHYEPLPIIAVDVGYSYLFAAEDALINKTTVFSTTSSYNVNAVSRNHAQLIGLQGVWKIDQDLYPRTK